MIFKVYYQETQDRNPQREETKSLFLEAGSEIEAQSIVGHQTTHNIEFIETLSEKALAYEKENPAFKITEFSE